MVAKVVGQLVKGLAPDGDPTKAPTIISALKAYANTIEPWAEAVAAAMVADVARRDRAMWKRNSKELGLRLGREFDQQPTGDLFKALQLQQVGLIKSLPADAAQRVHTLSQEAVLTGARATEIARDILRSGEVTEARARLIARTEVARASNNFVQARAQFAGSEGYIWRTSGDSDVRDSHAEMEGKYVRWSSPPTLDGLRGHAGTLPNCRCFAEPIFPND